MTSRRGDARGPLPDAPTSRRGHPSRRITAPAERVGSASPPSLHGRAPAPILAEHPADAVDRLPGSFHMLWGSALALLVIGIVAMYSISGAAGVTRADGDGLVYLRSQGLTAVAGLVFLLCLAALDYRRWRPFVPVVVVASVFMLLLVAVPGMGIESAGATRRVGFGGLTVQPSEFAKLAFVMGAAYLLAQRRFRRRTLGEYGPVILLGGALCLIIVAEDDLGTALVLAAAVFGMLWVGGLRVSHWVGLVTLGAALTGLAIIYKPYRFDRLMAFLDPSADPLKAGYQVRQAQIALSRGGLFGVGAGQSVQKFNYLPEAQTDMVFAVLGEEFGFLGLALIAGLFVLFALSAFHIARRCRDPFGKHLVAGFAFVIFSQAAINMGGVLGALPLTGIPLPFISFGRNNLLVVMAAVGIILSVARLGPAGASAAVGHVKDPVSRVSLEPLDVTYLDSRRRDRGSRRTSPRYR